MNKNQVKQSSRYLAMDILEQIEQFGAYSNLLLRQTIINEELKKEDANLLTELVYGVLQQRMLLDYKLEPFIKKQKKLDNWVRQVLRISLYQMIFLERIPNHAIINEAANIAHVKGHRGVVGLVNGVLRNIQRMGTRGVEEIKDKNKRLSIEYSLPLWLIEEFIQELGVEETKKLASSLSKRPKLSVRVNTSRIDRFEAMRMLKEGGYSVRESKISPAGMIVSNGVPTESKLFEEGYLAIQDESSMLVAPALNVNPEHRVLDVAAAPGGKAMHIATNFLSEEKGGILTALDIHKHKIKLIEDNASRQGVANIVEARQLDARKLTSEFAENSFDRVLVDAPCSGLGLMRRRPEIRYNKQKKDILSLQKLQLEIINEAGKMLKSGGEMIYSTCTITHLENQDVVNSFLKQNKNFEQISVNLPNDNLLRSKDGSITILPHQYDTDGFYIAKLRKT